MPPSADIEELTVVEKDRGAAKTFTCAQTMMHKRKTRKILPNVLNLLMVVYLVRCVLAVGFSLFDIITLIQHENQKRDDGLRVDVEDDLQGLIAVLI